MRQERIIANDLQTKIWGFIWENVARSKMEIWYSSVYLNLCLQQWKDQLFIHTLHLTCPTLFWDCCPIVDTIIWCKMRINCRYCKLYIFYTLYISICKIHMHILNIYLHLYLIFWFFFQMLWTNKPGWFACFSKRIFSSLALSSALIGTPHSSRGIIFPWKGHLRKKGKKISQL